MSTSTASGSTATIKADTSNYDTIIYGYKPVTIISKQGITMVVGQGKEIVL